MQATHGPHRHGGNILVTHDAANAQCGKQKSELQHVEQDRLDAKGKERKGHTTADGDQREVTAEIGGCLRGEREQHRIGNEAGEHALLPAAAAEGEDKQRGQQHDECDERQPAAAVDEERQRMIL